MKFSLATVAPPGFTHVAAFAEVTEALLHGLRALGHEASPTGGELFPDSINVLFGAHLLAGDVPLSSQTILMNLEQLEGNAYLPPRYLQALHSHVVWDCSPANVAWLRAGGARRVFHLPFGHVPQLERIRHAAADVDVLFYGVMNARRDQVLNRLVRAGAQVCYLANSYGAERDAWIARSRIVLNMHFHPGHILEMARVFYLLVNGAFVVSESATDETEALRLQGGLVFAGYGELAQTCMRHLADEPARARIARRGREAALACPQTAYLAAVLKDMQAAGLLARRPAAD